MVYINCGLGKRGQKPTFLVVGRGILAIGHQGAFPIWNIIREGQVTHNVCSNY